MEQEDDQHPVAPAEAAGPHSAVTNVKLPSFWQEAPVAWFKQVECVFRTKGVTDSLDKYCHVVAVLPPDTVRLIMDLVEETPTERPYEIVKDRLVDHLRLSEYERLDRLCNLPALGARKPSAMLATMLELCPRGEEKSRLFAGMFLQRLPRELRILLAHEDLADLKLLAARADALHTHHADRSGGVVYAVASSEVYPVDSAEVNAVASGPGAGAGRQALGLGGRGSGPNRGRFPKRGGRGGGVRGGQRESPATRQAREAAGLCYKHYMFGQSAYSCSEPGTCSWQGNGQAGEN
jgi:hypothetical protein